MSYSNPEPRSIPSLTFKPDIKLPCQFFSKLRIVIITEPESGLSSDSSSNTFSILELPFTISYKNIDYNNYYKNG